MEECCKNGGGPRENINNIQQQWWILNKCPGLGPQDRSLTMDVQSFLSGPTSFSSSGAALRCSQVAIYSQLDMAECLTSEVSRRSGAWRNMAPSHHCFVFLQAKWTALTLWCQNMEVFAAIPPRAKASLTRPPSASSVNQDTRWGPHCPGAATGSGVLPYLPASPWKVRVWRPPVRVIACCVFVCAPAKWSGRGVDVCVFG